MQHIDEIDDLVSQWTSGFPRNDLVEKLLRYRVPHAPVRDLSEVINDENMLARGSLQRITHPEFGDITVQHSPMRFGGVPLMPLRPSSKLGADRDLVFGEWLGLEPSELDELVKNGVL